MHLNGEYVRWGDLDPQTLFLLEDCTDLAISKMEGVPTNLRNLLQAVNQSNEPSIAIGRHFKSPFECDYTNYCWQHVLYYLDYETIFPAIPLFDNSSPYQQMPFQFSLHIQQAKGGDVCHLEFLHTELTDPRSEFVKALIDSCGTMGSVIVDNMGFESRINRELAAIFPQHAADLEKINERIVDLLVPFRSRYLYHPKMMGSASIKNVLPAFVPELNYSDLEISDGDMASRNYLKFLKDIVSKGEKLKIFDDIKRYCEMDTYAEVRLTEKLYEI